VTDLVNIIFKTTADRRDSLRRAAEEAGISMSDVIRLRLMPITDPGKMPIEMDRPDVE